MRATFGPSYLRRTSLHRIVAAPWSRPPGGCTFGIRLSLETATGRLYLAGMKRRTAARRAAPNATGKFR